MIILQIYMWTIIFSVVMAIIGEIMGRIRFSGLKMPPKREGFFIRWLQVLIILSIPFFNIFVSFLIMLMGTFLRKDTLQDLMETYG